MKIVRIVSGLVALMAILAPPVTSRAAELRRSIAPPELRVTPASPERIADAWTARLPVFNVDDYLFSYANIRYDNHIVISSDFKAAIPSALGKAVATDK